MTGRPFFDEALLPLADLEAVNLACLEFEARLKSGGRPSLADLVRRAPENTRPALFAELVRIELSHHPPRDGEPIAAYVAEFPQFESLARQAVRELQPTRPTSNQPGDTPRVASGKGNKESTELPLGVDAGKVVGSPPLPHAQPPQSPLRQFGEYEILRELGHGGMGVVYLARHRGLNRTVALKVIEPGRWRGMSEERRSAAIERFKAEGQAAAGLNHDHIVTVYEVGEVDSRRFYAMRYVEGVNLSQLVGDRPLDGRRAAAYLEPIARAIHAAHQRGIVHRDLKPSNILVETVGDRPYVADFGLAKLLVGGDDLTVTGEVFGTPQYMSPEQSADASKVTPATDIYALGATLYQLVTGRPPFQAANAAETLKQVIGREPVPPRQLDPAIDKDVETICLKCLDKSPPRRYASGADLADDLRRYLDHRAILARPLRRTARAWRWCRRNPLVAALSAAATALVICVAGVATAAYFREARLRGLASQRQRAAEESLKLAEKAIDESFSKIADDPRLRSPQFDRLRRDLLETSRDLYSRLANQTGDNPEVLAKQAEAYRRLARVSAELGMRQQAVDAFQKALEIYTAQMLERPGDDKLPRAAAETRANLANALYELGKYPESVAEYERAISDIARFHVDHSQAPRQDRMLATTQRNLAIVFARLDRLADAERLNRLSHTVIDRLAKQHPSPENGVSLATSHNNLGVVLKDLGRRPEAAVEYHHAIRIAERVVAADADHTDARFVLAAARCNLAGIHTDEDRWDDAATAYRQGIEDWRELTKRRPDHPNPHSELAKAWGNLYLVEKRLGESEQARLALQQELTLREEAIDKFPGDPAQLAELADCYNRVGLYYNDSGLLEESVEMQQKSLDVGERLLSIQPSQRFRYNQAVHHNNLAIVAEQSGRIDLARQSFERALAIQSQLSIEQPGDPVYRSAIGENQRNLGLFARDRGDLPAALDRLNESVDTLEELVEQQPQYARAKEILILVLNDRAGVYTTLGERDKAAADTARAEKLSAP